MPDKSTFFILTSWLFCHYYLKNKALHQNPKHLIEKGAELEKIQDDQAPQITAEETRNWLNHKLAINQHLVLEYQLLKKYTSHVSYDDGSPVYEHYQANQKNL